MIYKDNFPFLSKNNGGILLTENCRHLNILYNIGLSYC